MTIAGLAVSMVGVALVFFGLPQPEIRGDALLLESSPSQEELERRRAARRRLSYVALTVLFIGTELQPAGAIAD